MNDQMKRRRHDVLGAPCIFCGHNGVGYWQGKTHSKECPWYETGGGYERKVRLLSALSGVLGKSCLPDGYEPKADEWKPPTDDEMADAYSEYVEQNEGRLTMTNRPERVRVREAIADTINGWGNINPHRRLQIADQILALKHPGTDLKMIVATDSDQNLPDNPYTTSTGLSIQDKIISDDAFIAYLEAQQQMRDAGFVKCILNEGG